MREWETIRVCGLIMVDIMQFCGRFSGSEKSAEMSRENSADGSKRRGARAKISGSTKSATCGVRDVLQFFGDDTLLTVRAIRIRPFLRYVSGIC